MAITPVQPNIENTKSYKSYREAQGEIKTDNLIKPLPPEGHLVHDRLLSIPKFFVKDIVYDLKAVKDGFDGNANDHQLGRLNDVGLKLSGIGIATVLASLTKNPTARIMEYAGLGAFLAAMSIYPKVAIKMPSEILHGFDSGVEYIDDQGRKKSVFQDQNYIPFDMYQGEFSDEDLQIIGDKLGIPRDIKNRNDLTKEQMRKIAIQNNTLWMLTAGFAAPVITALLGCGAEKLIAPAVEKARIAINNHDLQKALEITESMTMDLDAIQPTSLSDSIEKILDNYKGKELPKTEYDKIIRLLTKEVDNKIATGIQQDVSKIFETERNAFLVEENASQDIIETIKKRLPKNKPAIENIFVPTEAEIIQAIKNTGSDGKYINADQIQAFKGELKQLIADKAAKQTVYKKEYIVGIQNKILEEISNGFKQQKSAFVNDTIIQNLSDLARIMGEFKANDKMLDSIKSFKVEETQETVLARSFTKFENTLLDVLDVKYKDLKLMRESDKYAKEILEQKLESLVKDKQKYEKAISKLATVFEEMEIKLNGTDIDHSNLADLINAIENNYNNTAKRLDIAGEGRFHNTIDQLIKDDVKTVKTSEMTREELFKLLDGTREAIKFDGLGIEETQEGARAYAKGIGSSKNAVISRIIDRYQGVSNTFRRILHTMDLYTREIPTDKLEKDILEKGKDVLLKATTTDHNLKLDTINNPLYYKQLMRTIWSGDLSEATKKGLGEGGDNEFGNVTGRFINYIKRFKDIMGNNKIDYTKLRHVLEYTDIDYKYHQDGTTNISKFNLVAQSPVEMVKKAAAKRYGNQLWLRRAAAIGGSVLGVTLLAQTFFGKISNPHNIQKQVKNDSNK